MIPDSCPACGFKVFSHDVSCSCGELRWVDSRHSGGPRGMMIGSLYVDYLSGLMWRRHWPSLTWEAVLQEDWEAELSREIDSIVVKSVMES